MGTGLIDEARMFWRFATGLRTFLQCPLSAQQCNHILRDGLKGREQSFLRLIRGAIYGFPRSPYRALLGWAGVEYGDVEKLVTTDGIESAMEKLYNAGVRISLAEFKGLRPLRRSGLAIELTAESFDNPLLRPEFEVESGGSTGARRRMKIDFDLLTHDAACRHAHLRAHGIDSRAFGIWRGIPPDSSGLKHALVAAKLGNPLARWFSPRKISWHPRTAKFALVNSYAVYGSRLWAGAIPVPQHVPLTDGRPVAAWLAEMAGRKTPALLSLAANNAVRVCRVALEEGLDIGGTMFRVSGEPFTDAKRRVIQSAGGETTSGWSMAETGPLGGGCAHREAVDEVHLYGGKIAAIERPSIHSDGESTINALFLTTVHLATPKIMLNLDSGDYGVLSRRRCGCPLEQAGFEYHLHTIRNHEKLTAGGGQFLGPDIIRLVEEVLPAAFGGYPTDYQFVEDEADAFNRISIVVSPRLGELDDDEIVNTVLRFLSSQSDGNRVMVGTLRQAGILSVSRCEPYVTPASKTPPLLVRPK